MSEIDAETFAPNGAIDAAIKEMLPAFSQSSQRRMKNAIRDAGNAAVRQQNENSDAGARHKFREFIPAYLLNRLGYAFEYEVLIGQKTPDWLDVNAHLLMESYTYERGGTSPFLNRVKSAVAGKCAKYQDLAIANSLRLIVSVYIDFLTFTSLEECYEDRAEFHLTFRENALLWGILFFTEYRPGLPIAGQPYGFLCLTASNDFQKMEKWAIPSVCVDD